MRDLTEQIKRYNGPKLADLMIQLFQANNTHEATSEAEVSGYYKDAMLNREYREVMQNAF